MKTKILPAAMAIALLSTAFTANANPPKDFIAANVAATKLIAEKGNLLNVNVVSLLGSTLKLRVKVNVDCLVTVRVYTKIGLPTSCGGSAQTINGRAVIKINIGSLLPGIYKCVCEDAFGHISECYFTCL
jgi:hypothetical protein